MNLNSIEASLMHSSTCSPTEISNELQDLLFRQFFRNDTTFFHRHCGTAFQRKTSLFGKNFRLCRATESPQLEVDVASGLVNLVDNRFPSFDLLLGVDSRDVVLISCFCGDDGSLCDEQGSRYSRSALCVISLAKILMDMVLRGAVPGERRLLDDVSRGTTFTSILSLDQPWLCAKRAR